MKSKLSELGVATILLSMSAVAAAKDIYVSPSGSDSNAGSSASAPLKTIAAASRQAYAGDTVWLMAGQYSESIIPARSGTSSSPITYKQYGTGSAKIVDASSGTNETAIYISGLSDIVIDGIDADGINNGPDANLNSFVTISGSTRIVVRNGTFRRANGWAGIEANNQSSYVTIEDNDLDMIGVFYGSNGEQQGEGILVQYGNPHHVLVQRNNISHAGHDCITIGGQYNVAQDNYMNNDWSDVIGQAGGYRNAVVFGSNNVFQRNYMTGSGPTLGSRDYAALLKVEGSNNIVRGNVFANAYYMAIQSDAGDWTPSGSKDLIYNNTFYKLGGSAWMVGVYAGYYRSDDVFKNNLVYESRQSPLNSNHDYEVSLWVKEAGLGTTARSTVMNNLFYPAQGKEPRVYSDTNLGGVSVSAAESAYPSYFSKNFKAVPQFTSSTRTKVADFTLSNSSEGVDRGAYLTTTTGSGRSTTVPVQDPYYFSDGLGITTGDTVQLQGSTTRAKVVSIDYSAKTLVLDTTVSFSSGQGIALSYGGSAPDVGAAEAGVRNAPMPPGGVSLK